MYNIYKYYLNLLDSINTEHRKAVTANELKRKERKINLLTEQLDLRDLYIRNAYQELMSNDIEFKYKNPKLVGSDEIINAPSRPQVIRISPSFKSLGELAKNMNVKVNNSNNIQTVSESKNNKSSEKNVKFKSSFKSQKNQQLVKDLNEIKNQIVKDTKISKKRQFNNEILNLFKYNPRIGTNLNKGGLDMGLFERKKQFQD